MLPCPWCVLAVRHEAPKQDINQAVRYFKGRAEAGYMTELQMSMVRSAAAEILHFKCVASTPEEAKDFVAGLEREVFNFWPRSPADMYLSGALAPPPPPRSGPRERPSSASAPRSRAQEWLAPMPKPRAHRASSAQASSADVPLETHSIFAPPPAVPPASFASRAASASTASRLAPEQGRADASSGAAPTSSSSHALVPREGAAASSAAAAAPEYPATPQQWVWQVHAGKAKKRYWKTVSDDLQEILEHAFVNGLDSTTWKWDGWTYYYEMGEMMQYSPGPEGEERAIRRVPAEPESR